MRSVTGVLRSCLSILILMYLSQPVWAQNSEDWEATLKRIAKKYESPAPATQQNPSKSASPVSDDNNQSPAPEPGSSMLSQREPEAAAPEGPFPEIQEEPAEEPQAIPPQLPAQLPAQPAFSDPVDQLDDQPVESVIPPEIPEDDALVRRFAPSEELVLSVVAAGFSKGEIFAITTMDSFRIGLLELSEVLDFAIDLNDDSTQASGWFISPTNGFDLSIDESGVLTAQSRGNQSVLGPDNYEIDGDLMVDAEYLSEWFGLTFALDEAKLLLFVSSELPFPFEAAERRRQQRLSGNYKTSVSVLPPINNSYRAFTPPLLDVQTFARVTYDTSSYGYSMVSRQDLAYLSTNLFVAGDKNDSLRDARLTFYKDSSEGNLLGPLGLTQISIGDVLPINAGIGTTSGFGRGISFNNIRDHLADNRIVNFTGIIQSGWDVELYRNGILLANDFDIQEGRYEFTDVELLFGNNDFELVFYGPQGQIERRNESYIVDQNALRANQNSFRFSAVDSNKTLLGVTNIAQDPTLEGFNAGLVFERGITDWYTLGFGSSILEPEEGDRAEQFSVRNNLSFGRYGIFNSVILFDNEERRNLLANYRTRVGDTNVSLNWQKNRSPLRQDGFTSTNVTDAYAISVSGKLFPGSRYTIGHENIWRKTSSDTNGDTETFRQSLSMVTRAGSFNHSFVGSKSGANGDDDWLISGELGYRGRFGRVFTRMFSTFSYSPDLDLNTVGAAVNYPFSANINSEFRYAYNVETSAQNYDARINWQADKVTLSGFASYSDSDNWSLNLTARFGIGVNNENSAFLMTSRPISQAGALAVRVFEDLDLDQEYDEGEPFIDNVEVTAPQVSRSDVTKNGTAFLTRLPNNRRTDIVIDETTLPDYTYLRLDDGFSVTGRRGLLQFAEIPFTRGGELDGTVYFVNAEGEEEPLPYVKLNLVDEAGEIVASTKSEFDGFYLFEKVIPGDYRLSIDERTLRQRNAIQEVTKEVNVTNQGDLFTEVDVVLRELNQAKGYIARVGSFKSLTLLKVYLGLLQKRVPPELIEDAFYLSPGEDDYFRIGISYSEEKLRADRSCEYAAQFQVDCQVEYVEFGY